LPYCSKCGALNGEDAAFCAKCGTPVSPAATPAGASGQGAPAGAEDFADRMKQEAERFSGRVRDETAWRFGREPPEVARTDAVLGSISAGAILVIIAVSILSYPDSLRLLGDYLRLMGTLNAFVRPPAEIVDVGAFFFVAVGVWSFILAVLRILVQRSARKALDSVLGALYCLYLAYLLYAYAGLRVGTLGFLAFAVVGLGLLVIGEGLVAAAMPWPRTPAA